MRIFRQERSFQLNLNSGKNRGHRAWLDVRAKIGSKTKAATTRFRMIAAKLLKTWCGEGDLNPHEIAPATGMSAPRRKASDSDSSRRHHGQNPGREFGRHDPRVSDAMPDLDRAPFSGTRMIKMLMLPAISGQVDPASVPHRELYSGARMPAIGLGTFGSDHAEPDEVANAVQGAYEVGCPPLRLCRCLRQRASRQHGISGIVHVRGAAVSAYSVSLFSVSVFLLTRDGANSRIPLVNDTGTVV
jgi:hypothetical protein